MNTPDQPVALPLDYAAQIVFELHSMRGECIEFARRLIEQSPLDEANLDECARLDEALARAHHVLAREVDAISAGQAKPKSTSK
jgi:hypothetical protein